MDRRGRRGKSQIVGVGEKKRKACKQRQLFRANVAWPGANYECGRERERDRAAERKSNEVPQLQYTVQYEERGKSLVGKRAQ